MTDTSISQDTTLRQLINNPIQISNNEKEDREFHRDHFLITN